MALNIVKNYATKFKRYGTKKTYTLDSIEIHTIGAAQNTVENIFNNMNQYNPAYGIVNAIVSADVENYVMEILPRDNVTWADGGYGNQHSFTVEICESDFMKYIPNSANYTVLNTAKFMADVSRGYINAVKYVAVKCKEFGFNPLDKLPNGLHRVYSHEEANKKGLATAHADPMHLWTKIGKTMDIFRNEVKREMDKTGTTTEGFQAADLKGLTEAERIEKIAPLYQDNMRKTGMLASVGIAQFCLESGYGKTDLAEFANNLHGMKESLSGNTWTGSVWDGVSIYGKESPEVYNGVTKMVYSEFRKYPNCEASIADRAAYFLNAMNGSVKRYPGIAGNKDYKSVINIIAAGKYATDPNYVSKLVNLVERWELFKYDDVEMPEVGDSDILPETEQQWYRVRLEWGTTMKGQIGAYHDLEQAKKKVDENPRYKVFDESGKIVYEIKQVEYKVQVGSFSNKENAEKRVKELAAIHIDSFIFEEDKQYKVQAGSYALKQNAMNRVGQIENLGFKAIIKEY